MTTESVSNLVEELKAAEAPAKPSAAPQPRELAPAV